MLSINLNSFTSSLSTGALSGVTMTTGVIITIVIIICLCIILLLVTKVAPHGGAPPVPSKLPGPSGCAAFRLILRMRKHASKVLFSEAQTYGSMFGIHFGRKPFCIITDHELVEQAFDTNADLFCDRGGVISAVVSCIQTRGTIQANGPAWVEAREFVAQNIRNKEFGRKHIDDCVDFASEKMARILDKHVNQAFNPKTIFQTYVADILHQICFGSEIFYTDPTAQKFIRTLDEAVVKTLNPGLLVLAFPSLVKTYFYRHLRAKVRYVAKYLKGCADNILQNKTSDEIQHPNLVRLYAENIKHIRKAGGATFAADDDGWRLMFDFFFAGVDTLHQALMWCALLLATHTHVQEKMRTEYSRIAGGVDSLSPDDRENAPYTTATMFEILRMRSVAPMGLPHFAAGNGTVAGYEIKKGSRIMANLLAMHNDPDTWDQPERFNPERFLDELGELDDDKLKLVIPFSIGPRSCPGQQIALMTIFKTLTTLVQRYEIGLPPGAAPSMDGVGSFTLAPKRFEIFLSHIEEN